MTSAPLPSVIPVLDLLGGVVVRAVRGERGHYQPMQSQLAAGSEPLVLARALLAHPACQGGEVPVLYIADLDAIQGRGVQTALLRQLLEGLRSDWPRLCLWLDAGFADARAAATAIAALQADEGAVRPVFGSESLQSLDALAALTARPEAILSLDCRRQQALDPSGSWQQPALWPATLIVMTLDRVGAGQGPDLDTFDRLRTLAVDRTMVGAGGIRSRADLAAGHAAGATAWLVASALHDGQLA
jgi:uncharacterized protein related to proFAR isomerase